MQVFSLRSCPWKQLGSGSGCGLKYLHRTKSDFEAWKNSGNLWLGRFSGMGMNLEDKEMDLKLNGKIFKSYKAVNFKLNR